jgi:hypothetical protein
LSGASARLLEDLDNNPRVVADELSSTGTIGDRERASDKLAERYLLPLKFTN